MYITRNFYLHYLPVTQQEPDQILERNSNTALYKKNMKNEKVFLVQYSHRVVRYNTLLLTFYMKALYNNNYTTIGKSDQLM